MIKASFIVTCSLFGAGPSGLFTALNAGRAGQSVILADEDFQMGGRLLSDLIEIDQASPLEWISKTLAELESLPNVRLLPRTTIYGIYDHGIYGGLETKTDEIGKAGARQILWRIYAKHSLLAAGATERPIAFANNDRPGIMLASAVRTYQNRYRINFENLALLTNNDDGLSTHNDLLIDTRNEQHVIDTKGRKGLKFVTLNTGETHNINTLAVSGGWNPNVHLTCHKRGRPVWNEGLACFVPDTKNLPKDMSVIGAANGIFSTHGAYHSASQTCKNLDIKSYSLPVAEDTPVNVKALWHINGKKRAWVDFQNDVTAKDITLAHQEGFSSVEHVKSCLLYTSPSPRDRQKSRMPSSA